MSRAPAGRHYCRVHQGNTSHYDIVNCELCQLRSALEAFVAKARCAQAATVDTVVIGVLAQGIADAEHALQQVAP